MASKLAILAALLALSTPVLSIQARQTDSPNSSTAISTTSAPATTATSSTGTSSASSDSVSECSSAASAIYKNFPEKPEALSKASESFYATASRTAESPTPDCEFIASLPTDVVDPVLDRMVDIKEWSEITYNKIRISYLTDHCYDQLGDSGTPEACRSEAVAWLEQAGVSENEFEEKFDAGGSRAFPYLLGRRHGLHRVC